MSSSSFTCHTTFRDFRRMRQAKCKTRYQKTVSQKTLDAMSKNGVPKKLWMRCQKTVSQKTLDAMSKNGVPKKLWIMVVNIELYSVAG